MASRASVLIDAATYFTWLERTLQKAQRSILIVGWDFDGRMELAPGSGQTLGDFLRSLVEDRPDLEVRILMWSVGVIHGPGAALPMLLGAPWEDHPRIQVRLDHNHPIYGAHHQKIVCVDDAVAFAGGTDLTIERWDTCEHRHRHPQRKTPDGEFYPPVHDVQIAVDGEAAHAIGDVARRRWHLATGERIEPRSENRSLWPDGLAPQFRDVALGIACTLPLKDDAVMGEAAKLTLDAISHARRILYIEAQYLTAARIEKKLAKHLESADGPEVVIVLTCSSPGWLERIIMGANRDRLLRRLTQKDKHGRLRVYYPVVPAPEGDCPVEVHSKVIVVDDTIVRIGSSNLNNRSIGLDSECDIAIEASDDVIRRAIRGLRDQLLAEHLGTDPDTFSQTVEREGSVIGAIQCLNVGARCLRPFPMRGSGTRPLPLTWLLDPERPFKLFSLGRCWRSVTGGRFWPWQSDRL